MAAFVLIVQIGSLWLSATEYISSQPPLENPESVGYSFFYIIALLIFTAVLIFLIKKNKTLVIRAIIYFAIAVTLFYVFIAVLDKAVGYTDLTLGVSLIAAVLFAVLLYKFPEWYVIDAAGLLISIGACAVIGVSLSYVPIIVLMVALLVYDFISVYKTKHMLTLANGMMDLKLPILFVIPKKRHYSYIDDDFSDEEDNDEKDGRTDSQKEPSTIEETAVESIVDTDSAAQEVELTGIAKDEKEIRKKKSDALFMGLGDAVIPTLLVISANHFLEHDGLLSVPALFTMIGTFAGFAVLMYVVSKGNPQAGLPFLNTGAIIGFIAGVLISGTAISFSLGL